MKYYIPSWVPMGTGLGRLAEDRAWVATRKSWRIFGLAVLRSARAVKNAEGCITGGRGFPDVGSASIFC